MFTVAVLTQYRHASDKFALSLNVLDGVIQNT